MISGRALVGLAIAAAIAVLAAVASQPDDTGPAKAAEAPLLPDLDRATLAEVDGLRVTAADGQTTLQRGESGWQVAELDGYPAKTARVERTLVQLSELVKKEPKTASESFYGRLDLQAPEAEGSNGVRATVLKDGEALAAVIRGKSYEPGFGGTPGVYVRRPDGERAWLAAGSLDTLTQSPTGWVDTQIANIQAGKLAAVALSGGPREAPLAFERGEGEGAQLQPAEDLSLTNREPLETAANFLAGLQLADVRAADGLPGGSGDVGVRYTTQDGLVVTVDNRTVEGEPWITLAAQAGEGAGEAVRKRADKLDKRWQGWAYRIAADDADALMVTRSDLQTEPES